MTAKSRRAINPFIEYKSKKSVLESSSSTCHAGLIVIHQSIPRSLLLINFKDLDEMRHPYLKQTQEKRVGS